MRRVLALIALIGSVVCETPNVEQGSSSTPKGTVSVAQRRAERVAQGPKMVTMDLSNFMPSTARSFFAPQTRSRVTVRRPNGRTRVISGGNNGDVRIKVRGQGNFAIESVKVKRRTGGGRGLSDYEAWANPNRAAG